jgi:hypothetical protein
MEGLKAGKTEGEWYHGTVCLWSTSKCARELGYTTKTGKATADKIMRRKGLRPYPINLSGRGRENLWRASEVEKLGGYRGHLYTS